MAPRETGAGRWVVIGGMAVAALLLVALVSVSSTSPSQHIVTAAPGAAFAAFNELKKSNKLPAALGVAAVLDGDVPLPPQPADDGAEPAAGSGAFRESKLRNLMHSGAWRDVQLDDFTQLANALIDTAAWEGDSAELKHERQIYITLARQPNVKRICEIGFNRGASASLWLKANPTAEVLMFDLWQYEYAARAEKSLRSPEIAQRFSLVRATERLTVVKGSSVEQVPKYAAANPDVKCDILSVDGGHTYDIAIRDIVNMHALANPNGHVLLVDDTNCEPHYCVDKAVTEAMRRGLVKRLFGVSEGWMGAPPVAHRGVTVLQYQWPKLTPPLRAVLDGSWQSTQLDGFSKLAASLTNTPPAEADSADLKYERQIYITLARQPNVKRICEIGFNRGSSASLWLKANPRAQVLMFDLWQHAYAAEAEKALLDPKVAAEHGLERVADRLTIVKGSSLETVPQYVAAHPDVKCDVLSVDGGHTYDIAIRDIVNMHALANPNGNVLLVDDTNCRASFCVDSAVEEAQRLGLVKRVYGASEGWRDIDGTITALRGVTVLQYQ